MQDDVAAFLFPRNTSGRPEMRLDSGRTETNRQVKSSDQECTNPSARQQPQKGYGRAIDPLSRIILISCRKIIFPAGPDASWGILPGNIETFFCYPEGHPDIHLACSVQRWTKFASRIHPRLMHYQSAGAFLTYRSPSRDLLIRSMRHKCPMRIRMHN